MTLRLGVALSGRGTTLQNLLDRIALGTLSAQVVCVAASRNSAFGLERARRAGIPALAFTALDFPDTAAASAAIFAAFDAHEVQIVVLAGYMRKLVLPPHYRNRVLNIHPALLPAFGGKGMYGDHVHQAVLAAGASVSGCTVHVVDEEYDHGRILMQERVPVVQGDIVESLRERVQEAEQRLYPAVIERIAKHDGDIDAAFPPSI